VDKVDVIFMDIEGAEIETIKGMKEILSRSPDVIILTEWTTKTYIRNNQTEFEAII
jgi:DNA-binding NarL/FixJ family response regulator